MDVYQKKRAFGSKFNGLGSDTVLRLLNEVVIEGNIFEKKILDLV